MASPFARIAFRALLPFALLGVLVLAGFQENERGENIGTVTMRVDLAKQFQTMEGFGATHVPLVRFPKNDHLNPPLRSLAVDAVYHQVGLNTGNVEVGVIEAPSNAKNTWKEQANDDDDPFHYNWSGFNFVGSEMAKEKLIDLARPLGFNDYYLGLKVSVRWANPWLKAIRKRDYERYLNEAAEQIVAGHTHWRDAYGIVPRFTQLLNEPTSGNQELDPGSNQEMIDVIKRTGDRLRKEGFPSVKFLVPGEESEAKSLESATAILADPGARQYVGAIAYHAYPYGSIYSSVQRVLETSGSGKPDPQMVKVRNQLRDLGQKYGLRLWMTEISHGGVPALSFEGLLARAIHIHDEFVYANASAYFGMSNWADTEPIHGNFGEDDPYASEGHAAIVDLHKRKVFITGMGYAIGHYARWIKRGAVRIEAASSDPLLQVTAFRDDGQKRLVLVLINNSANPSAVGFNFTGFPRPGALTFKSEQSTAQARWVPGVPLNCDVASGLRITLPRKSVTTLAANL